jgi:hypothetical protein
MSVVRAYCNICNGVVPPYESSPWICVECTTAFQLSVGFFVWPELIDKLGDGNKEPLRRCSPDAPIVPELAARIADAESQSLKLAVGLAQRRQEVLAGTGKAPHWESVKAPKRTRLCDD